MRPPVIKNLLISVGCLLLTAMLLASAALPAAGSTATPAVPEADALDFSNPASDAVEKLPALELFRALLPDRETVSEAELEYLSALADHPLAYSYGIPLSCVQADYADGTLTVTALPYTYTAANGETVTWVPCAEATLRNTADGEALPLSLSLSPRASDGAYVGTLAGISDISPWSLSVPYTTSLTVPAEEAERCLNLPLQYADALLAEQAAYEERLSAYNAYCSYLTNLAEYEAALAVWQAYLSAMEKYEQKLAAYEAYEQAMDTYRQNVAAYETYLTAQETYRQLLAEYEAAWAAHVQATNAYERERDVYERNAAELAAVADCLSALDCAFATGENGHQVYATLMGDTVAEVVRRKDELLTLEVRESDIDTADRATHTLQTLLTEYNNTQGIPARFAYYQAHYTEIKQSFIDLYGALYAMYANSNVKTALINRDKLERYMEFVAQLYVISTAIDDAVPRSEDWLIAGRYQISLWDYQYFRYTDLLETAYVVPDKNNADPADVYCPAEVLPEPTAPLFTLPEPTPPAEVAEPIEPDTVIRPAEPAAVPQPTPPAELDPVPMPVAPMTTPLQQQLMAERVGGTLAPRTATDTVLTFDSAVQKNLCPHTVTFYDYDEANRLTQLYAVGAEAGEPVIYNGPAPSRQFPAPYDYRFVGWRNEAGTLLTDATLGESDGTSRHFVAAYELASRTCTVTWSVDGRTTAQTLTYGTVPNFGVTPEKEATDAFTYTFVGWRSEGVDCGNLLPGVTADVTYEAVFVEMPRPYTVTWVFSEGNAKTELWSWGTVPVCHTVPERSADTRYVYVFSGWDTTPTAVTGNATYTAQYTALPLLSVPTASNAPLSVTLQDGVYAASLPTAAVQVDRLFALALQQDVTVSLLSADGSVSLSFNEAAMTNFLAAGGTCLFLDAAEGTVTLRLTDAAGRPVSPDATVTLRLAASAYTKVWTQNETGPASVRGEYQDGILTVKVKESAVLTVREEYAVTVQPCENGFLNVNMSSAPAGTAVTLTLTHTDAYRKEHIRVAGALTGTLYPVGEDLTFQMPAEPVTVSATLVRKTYTVTFVVDGQVILSQVYESGQSLVLPAAPTKEPSDDTVYSFVSWSPVISPTVTADATYTAVFRESTPGSSSVYVPSGTYDRAYLFYLKVIAVLVLLIGAPVATVRFVRRRRRQKQADEPDEPTLPPTHNGGT